MHREQRQWLKRDTIVPYKSIHKLLIFWQNRFEWFLYLKSWITLCNSKQKYDWKHLTRSILLVWNSFIKNRFTTKSNEFKSVFLNGQTSRPYSKTGIHLVNMRCKTTSSEAILPLAFDLWRFVILFIVLLWSPYVIGQTIYIFILFLLSSFFFLA